MSTVEDPESGQLLAHDMADMETGTVEQNPHAPVYAPAPPPMQPNQPLTPEMSDMDVINDVAPKVDLPDTEEATLLLSIIQDYNRAEEYVRYGLVKKCRKHLNYWNDLQYLAWDEVAHDWRTADDIIADDPTSDIDPAVHAKVINIYKAHGEIFIGALSSGIPNVRFFPEDADSAEDVQAAKAKSKLAELIQRQNTARLLLMKSLFILYNQGMVACYNENKADYRFGSIKTPAYADVNLLHRNHYCPNCGFDLGADTHDPTSGNVPLPEEQTCPQCGQTVTPEMEHTAETQRTQIGENSEPKNRECLEIYGPLNVKIPLWCRDQFSTPYLILETEEDLSLIQEIYPEFIDRISAGQYPDGYDKEARVPTNYKNDFPRNLVTVQRVWLRPWALNTRILAEPILVKKLRAQYPDGIYVVVLNNSLVVEIVKDDLDKRWTISENPVAESLHANPLGSSLVPLQDMTNELANLTLETVEFGIPETFADGRVIDFDAYQRQEARPGQISEATAPAGQGLASGFYEMKAATLSREVDQFAERVTQAAQFVQGTYPSIYGGTLQGGGGTAREYELSKASALQRLSTTWLIVQEWWAKIMGKAVDSTVENMKEDERYVQQQGSNFMNVWIRKADLQGSTSRVEPEIAENFPVSWAQKKDAILNLIQMKDPQVSTVISHPENASLVASIIGVPELYIPGDDDRNKQLMEISLLIRAEPQQVPPNPNNPRGLVSTVPVVSDLDNNDIEAEICKSWLKSEVGQDAKVNNPGGYANVLAHLREHLFFIAQVEMAAQEKEMDDKGLAKKGKPNADGKPDTGQSESGLP